MVDLVWYIVLVVALKILTMRDIVHVAARPCLFMRKLISAFVSSLKTWKMLVGGSTILLVTIMNATDILITSPGTTMLSASLVRSSAASLVFWSS